MRRYIVFVPFIVTLAVITLFLTSVQPTDARWHLWDCTAIEAHSVCRDGMYFSLGWTCGFPPTPDDLDFDVTASRVSTGEVLFTLAEEVPKQEVPYPTAPWIEYYEYYARLWQDGNLSLNPGEQVNVHNAGGLTISPFTVEDCSMAPDQPAASTSFSYQGTLFDGDAPANGVYDLQFTLWNAGTGGTMVGNPIPVQDVTVEDGLFTVELDFGQEAFSGSARWLAMGVRPGNSGGAYTPLTPRQELLSVPFASSLVAGAVISQAVPGPALAIHNELGHGLEVSGGNYGIVVGSVISDSLVLQNPGENGIVVNHPGNDGVVVYGAGRNGVTVEQASGFGVEILDGGNDALRIVEASDDGIQIGDFFGYPNYGLYIPSPGVNFIGLWPNTANNSGEWALYTVDKIAAGNVTSTSLTQLALVAEGASLRPGDVAAVSGMTEANVAGNRPVPLVQAVDSSHTGVIGVVETRLMSQPAPGKDGENVLHSAPGPASAGEYVALTVYGVSYVRVEEGAALSPGGRLAASEIPGHARPLKTEEVNGIQVSESAPTLGIVLDTAADGELVPVFVTLR